MIPGQRCVTRREKGSHGGRPAGPALLGAAARSQPPGREILGETQSDSARETRKKGEIASDSESGCAIARAA
jgi:hypothetical protein